MDKNKKSGNSSQEGKQGNLSMSDHLAPSPTHQPPRGAICSAVLTYMDCIHGAATSDFLLRLAKRCLARGGGQKKHHGSFPWSPGQMTI